MPFEEPKIPTGYRQGFITAITVLLTASLLYFRFSAFETGSGDWTTLGAVSVFLLGISVFIQLSTLWRALQPDDERKRVYKITLRWFASAVLLLVGSFATHLVASLVYGPSPLAQICARVDHVNGLQENSQGTGQDAASEEVRAEFRALVEQCRKALRDRAEEKD